MRANPTTKLKPLFVDLDGSLIATDVLWESVVLMLKKSPWRLPQMFVWVLRGKSIFKQKLAELVVPDVRVLPYRKRVVSFIEKEKMNGREVVLATATERTIAEKIAKHLGLFDAVLATDQNTNLSGRRKLEAIREYSGNLEAQYIGDTSVDLPIWQALGNAIVVNPPKSFLTRIRDQVSETKVIEDTRASVRAWLRATRLRQWIKNLLLFVPMLTSHQFFDLQLWITGLLSFIAFGFCASGIYVLNDLVDLESDRMHPRKKYRPFASGVLKISHGVLLIPILLAISAGISLWLLPPGFLLALAGYLFATTAYSLSLKRIPILDVLLLAFLYTYRVLAGGVCMAIEISTWLMAFSMFFFLSLAFLKRYSELRLVRQLRIAQNKARGYIASDIDLVRTAGLTSGFMAVMVLSLYINSPEVKLIYESAQLLWIIGFLLLYWLARMWLLAGRGIVQDDPLVFATRDLQSHVIGLMILFVVIISAKLNLR